jgi:ribosomal protein S18 acetylase RimI-like enzyme
MRNRLDNPVTITRAKSQKQIDACLAIARELQGQFFTEEGITTMNQDLQKHPSYVAVSSNEVAGFAVIDKKSNRVAEIMWMAVKQENQRRGIGSVLITQVVNELALQGIKVLEVKTLASFDKDKAAFERTYAKTKRFYEKIGFIHLETIDPYPAWEPDNPCAIYIKVL